jgi:hypothetical protein
MKNVSRETLVAIFGRRGQQTEYSGIFELLPEHVRTKVEKHLIDDLPVLCEYGDERLLFLTDQRLVFKEKEKTTEIALSELREVEASIATSAILGARNKMELSVLRLMLANGSLFELRLNSGPSFFGWWNVLKSISDR